MKIQITSAGLKYRVGNARVLKLHQQQQLCAVEEKEKERAGWLWGVNKLTRVLLGGAST